MVFKKRTDNLAKESYDWGKIYKGTKFLLGLLFVGSCISNTLVGNPPLSSVQAWTASVYIFLEALMLL